MPTSTLFAFCYLPGNVESVPAGRFVHDPDGNIGLFQYGQRFLARPDAIAVDCVSLPLVGEILPVATNGGLYGAFRDSSPDYWGRLVAASRLGQPSESISEIDYLADAGATRVGNLDFRRSLEEPDPDPSLPQFHDLESLMDAAEQIEEGHPVDEDAGMLLGQGSSVGGARPKCTVHADDQLWLAKFPSRQDTIDVPLLEYATMELARKCSLDVPETRVAAIGSRNVFLIKRFDRDSTSGEWSRRGFLSALSLAEWDERDHHLWSYVTVAERIRQYAVHPSKDLRELFRRIAFNILVRNTDDHPRNHGFLVESNGVSLSPLYDVVPQLARAGVSTEFYLAMGLGEGGRLAALNNLFSVAEAFNLKTAQGREIGMELSSIVTSSWKEVMADAGFCERTIEVIAPSFAHSLPQ